MHQNTTFYKENDVKNSKYWYNHFNQNLKTERVNWELKPQLSNIERNVILKSLQAWQLGETSDGRHLLKASEKYAQRNNDLLYIEAVKLFIKEEQKHGNNLGKYLDLISEKKN